MGDEMDPRKSQLLFCRKMRQTLHELLPAIFAGDRRARPRRLSLRRDRAALPRHLRRLRHHGQHALRPHRPRLGRLQRVRQPGRGQGIKVAGISHHCQMSL